MSGHRLPNLQGACSGPSAKVLPSRSGLYCRRLALLSFTCAPGGSTLRAGAGRVEGFPVCGPCLLEWVGDGDGGLYAAAGACTCSSEVHIGDAATPFV